MVFYLFMYSILNCINKSENHINDQKKAMEQGRFTCI